MRKCSFVDLYYLNQFFLFSCCDEYSSVNLYTQNPHTHASFVTTRLSTPGKSHHELRKKWIEREKKQEKEETTLESQ